MATAVTYNNAHAAQCHITIVQEIKNFQTIQFYGFLVYFFNKYYCQNNVLCMTK